MSTAIGTIERRVRSCGWYDRSRKPRKPRMSHHAMTAILLPRHHGWTCTPVPYSHARCKLRPTRRIPGRISSPIDLCTWYAIWYSSPDLRHLTAFSRCYTRLVICLASTDFATMYSYIVGDVPSPSLPILHLLLSDLRTQPVNYITKAP